MKKLLVLSHAGVLDVNRAVFQAMAKVSQVEVTMVVPTNWRGDLIRDLHFKPSANDHGIRVIALPAAVAGNGSLFFYSSSLKKALNGWKPDHVFVDEEPWSVAAFQAFRVFGDIEKSFFTKQNLKKRIPPPFRWFEKHVFGKSVRAYSVASEVTDVLRAKGFKKPIVYLPHSFDPAIFHPFSDEQKRKRRQELGISEDACVFGCFGRMTEEKGIRDLLGAMKKMQAVGSRAKLHFLWVGNGPLFEEVKNEIGAGATLIPAVPHDRVGETLAATDILVLPSRTTPQWKEQFGRILVEAMACGAAVVGSDSGEIPHLIARCGGGVSFAEKNVEELSRTLLGLAEDSKRLDQYKAKGLAYVHAHLTHEAVARELAGSIQSSV